MNVSQVLELLSQNAYVLREDVSLMETGFVRCDAFGADVTREQTARLKGNLSRIEEIIDALGDCGTADYPNRKSPPSGYCIDASSDGEAAAVSTSMA